MTDPLVEKYRALLQVLAARRPDSVCITLVGPRDIPDTLEILRARPTWPEWLSRLGSAFRERASSSDRGPARLGACELGVVMVEADGYVGAQSLGALTHAGRSGVNVYAEGRRIEIIYAHDGAIRAWVDPLVDPATDVEGPDAPVLATALQGTPWGDEPLASALVAAERIVGFGPSAAWWRRPHRRVAVQAPRDGLVPAWLAHHRVLNDPLMKRMLDDPQGSLRAIVRRGCEMIVAARGLGADPDAAAALAAVDDGPDAAWRERLTARRDADAEAFLASRRSGPDADRSHYLDATAWAALAGAFEEDALTAAGRVLFNAGRCVLKRAITPEGAPFGDDEVWLYLMRRCERRVYLGTERSRHSAIYY